MSDLKNFSGEVVFLGGVSHAALAELNADSPWMMATYPPDLPNGASRPLGSQGVWWCLAIGLLVYCVSYLSGSERVYEISSHTHGIYKMNERAMALRQ